MGKIRGLLSRPYMVFIKRPYFQKFVMDLKPPNFRNNKICFFTDKFYMGKRQFYNGGSKTLSATLIIF
jgi:hypothetical protein